MAISVFFIFLIVFLWTANLPKRSDIKKTWEISYYLSQGIAKHLLWNKQISPTHSTPIRNGDNSIRAFIVTFQSFVEKLAIFVRRNTLRFYINFLSGKMSSANTLAHLSRCKGTAFIGTDKIFL